MIALMDLRPGNYVHPAMPGKDNEPDAGRYLRILSIDLLAKQVTAKADGEQEIHTLNADAIYPCALDVLMRVIGGLSFGDHSILLQDGAVAIIHENGSLFHVPHIQYVHQFQNLFRSLTGQEFPYNVK